MRASIFLLSLGVLLFGSCNWESPHPGGSPRGSAHIVFDGVTYNVLGVYFGGDTAAYYDGFGLRTSFGTYPSASYHSLSLNIDTFRHTGIYYFDTSKRIYLGLTTEIPPFTGLKADSGQVTFDWIRNDSAVGSLSARLRGDDSSIHHITASFVASSPFPID